MFVLRAGVSNHVNNNDLVYIGKLVNLAVKIANSYSGPKNIGITDRTYSNLDDETIYVTKNNQKVNMWKDDTIEWNGKDWNLKKTNYYWNLSL